MNALLGAAFCKLVSCDDDEKKKKRMKMKMKMKRRPWRAHEKCFSKNVSSFILSLRSGCVSSVIVVTKFWKWHSQADSLFI